ncbi:hypothetical protein CVT25_012959 [Psilocybe cyanescens]|uniref:Uncharacterized protein n=1 Tax=Psilocybe cyanescens TaxID=93625 RepID=A0A409XLD1_PSICY|nr:hypothetical protein CVT25_012959 [Psilocybe cyanescens]
MPIRSIRKRWTDQLTETYTRQQHRKLERELASDDDSPSTGMSEGSDHDPLADLNDPATFEAAIASVQQELEDLSLDLEIEMLDLKMSNNVDMDMDMEGSPSPTSPSSPTLSDVEDDIKSIARQWLSTLIQYMQDN